MIKGIKVSNSEKVTHTLFVDDVLVFGEGTIKNLEAFVSLIDKYKRATGMVVNMEKYNLFHNEFLDDMIRRAREIMLFRLHMLKLVSNI